MDATQKLIAFYHDKGNDMLQIDRTISDLAIICLHISTDTKLYLFMVVKKDLAEKVREDNVGGSSNISTRKKVADDFFTQKFQKLYKSIVETDASYLYSYSMSQHMANSLFTC